MCGAVSLYIRGVISPFIYVELFHLIYVELFHFIYVWSYFTFYIRGFVSPYICGVVSPYISICGVVLLHVEVLEYRETEVIVLCRYKPPILIAVSSCLQQSSLIYTSAVSASTLRHTTEVTVSLCLFTYNL